MTLLEDVLFSAWMALGPARLAGRRTLTVIDVNLGDVDDALASELEARGAHVTLHGCVTLSASGRRQCYERFLLGIDDDGNCVTPRDDAGIYVAVHIRATARRRDLTEGDMRRLVEQEMATR